MTVDIGRARSRADHAGRTFFFCGGGCQRQFEADPAKYLPDDGQLPVRATCGDGRERLN